MSHDDYNVERYNNDHYNDVISAVVMLIFSLQTAFVEHMVLSQHCDVDILPGDGVRFSCLDVVDILLADGFHGDVVFPLHLPQPAPALTLVDAAPRCNHATDGAAYLQSHGIRRVGVQSW